MTIHLTGSDGKTFCGQPIADLAVADPHGGVVYMVFSVSGAQSMYDNHAKRADCRACLAAYFAHPMQAEPQWTSVPGGQAR